MLTLALVAGMKPSTGKCGPNVLLGEGKFRIVAENVKDTKFALCHSSGEHEVEHESPFALPKTTKVWLKVTTAGTEDYITVFAEHI